jgi:uncharacterized membrane protein YbhN (UPF0104 family)
MKARSWAYWFAIFLVAVLLLGHSVRGTDWRRVTALLLGARWSYTAVALSMATAALVLRALRWRILLNPEAPVTAETAFWATTAGYFGNSFLPARAGELVRTQIISSRSGLCRSYVLATAVSERIADAVVLVLIGATVLLALPAKPAWFAGAATPLAAAGFAGVAAIAMLPRLESLGKRILGGAPLSPAFRGRAAGILEDVLRGLRAFHDGGRLARFFAFTACIWVLDAMGTVLVASALGLSITIPVAFLLVASLGLASALPSTPGYVGIYQFVAVGVLTPFGLTRTAAIAYIVFAQALSYALIVFWGTIGLLWGGQTTSIKAASAAAL